MEENYQQRKNKKTLLAIVGIAVLVVAVVGVTYAFFNYTRTGTSNTIRVGRIAFNTTQSSGANGAINLSNVFPIDSEDADTDADNVGEVTIAITGDTDYDDGVEYLVTATGVTNIVGGKTVPISVIVTPNSGLGTESSTYYSTRSSASGSIYKVEAGETITNNGRILVGYIKQNSELGTASGINGTITIKAFLDKDLIAISDTVNGPVGNETDPNWVNGRTVLTTSEWESLRTNGLSFQVRVEANEGVWVKQITTMSLSASSGSVAPNANTTATITTNGDGALSCTSTDTSVATCSITGTTLTVTGVAEGNTTITVNQAEGTNYGAASKTYSVTVKLSAADYIKNNVSGLQNVAGAYRYVGVDPDNYVWFNNEQWRIIGVYGDQLKIIKATPSTTSQQWQNTNSDGNVWSGSLMQSTYLYNTYWPTLNSTAQGMVNQSATWNVGACSYNIAAADAYTCAQGTTWTGKIGLIATYEYLYAAENTCWTKRGIDYGYGNTCQDQDWLFSTVTNSGGSHAWTLSPYSDHSRSALLVLSIGYVNYDDVNLSYAASPVVYLKSTITITGGNGGSGQTNSYKLG